MAASQGKTVDEGTLEKQVLETVRSSGGPTEPVEVVSKIGSDEGAVRRVIRSLVDRGELRVTLDWKLRAANK